MSEVTMNFMAIMPEIFVAVAACAMVLDSVFGPRDEKYHVMRLCQNAALALLVSMLVMFFGKAAEISGAAFAGQFILNDFTLYAKGLILLGGAAVLVLSSDSLEREGLNATEFPALVLLSTLGMMLMVSANDLITLFMGLELQSLALYVLVAMNRQKLSCSEAAIKYFVLGALSTGFYLYGASFVYGYVGSTNFEAISAVVQLASGQTNLGLVVGILFVVSAFAFKISVAPFHMWTPDVYQGTPTAVTTFLASTPKVAALLLFVRVMFGPFGAMTVDWQSVVMALALLSMVVGAFAALQQTDIKRLLAYSSIGHMGYALVGMAAGSYEGMQSVLLYVTIYLVATVGVFGCLLTLRGKNHVDVKNIEDLSGLAKSHPRMALTIAIFMFSMAGIPPLAGFFAKLYVFMAAVQAGLITLAILGVLSSVVAAYYYLRIIKVMYFDEMPEKISPTFVHALVITPANSVLINISVLFALFFFAFPTVMMNAIQQAVSPLQGF